MSTDLNGNRAAVSWFRPRLFFAVLLTAASFFSTVPLWSDEENSQAPDGTELDTAPVVVDGETLFHVIGITSLPPGERAGNIAGNIIAAARDRSIDPSDIAIVTTPEGINEIMAGSRRIMKLLEEDAAIEGVDLDLFSTVVLEQVISAVKDFRHARSRAQILKQSLFLAGAIALTVLFVLILNWVFRKFSGLVERRIRSMIDAVEDKSFHLVRSAQIWKVIHALFGMTKTVLIIMAVITCIVYGLGLLPWTRNVSSVVLDTILEPLRTLARGFLSIVPNLLFLAVIVLVTRYVMRLLRLFFNGIREGNFKLRNLEPELALPTYHIIRLLLLLFAIVIAYPYIPGSQSPAFKALSVFVGVLFSLGSSSVIGNIIAGYTMTFRKAFRPGDRIMVDGQVGFVVEQKTMITRVRTLKNEEIVIPNSVLINSSIVNYSTTARLGGVIVHTPVRVGYETPWRLVEAMLQTAADRTEGLLKDPPSFVLKKALGEFAIEYEINAWCTDIQSLARVYSELHGHILDIFNENAIQIMRPAYEGDPETPKVVPVEEWFRSPVPSGEKGDPST